MSEPFLSRIRDLKFKQLLVFERTVVLGSTHKAAEDLHMSQPNVFKIISQLEALLGVPLFERNTKGVLPTIFAIRLLERVKPMLGDARAMGEELNHLRNAERGQVNVGTLISASARLLPQSIALMKRLHPKVDIAVHEANNHVLFPMLMVGELDLIVGRLPEARNVALDYHSLYEEQLMIVARTGHPLASREDFTLDELLAFAWILPIPSSPVRAKVDNFFVQHKLPFPESRIESLSLLTNLGILHHSDAVAMLPRAVAQPLIKAGSLRALLIQEELSFGTIGYSLRSQRLPTPTTTAFIRALEEVSREIAVKGEIA